ncbi:MAG: hypothetical protein ACYTFT_18125 [Planctomycetota bacterium]|jgi:hypothetical protein
MSQTMFGRPIAPSDAWDEQSTYTFVLKSDGDQGSAPMAFMLRGAAAGPPKEFRPNVVVTRKPKGPGESVSSTTSPQN